MSVRRMLSFRKVTNSFPKLVLAQFVAIVHAEKLHDSRNLGSCSGPVGGAKTTVDVLKTSLGPRCLLPRRQK